MRRQAYRLLVGIALATAMIGTATAETDGPPRVVATYFHRTLRCQTCLHIESLAHYDVTDVMANDIDSGQLVWRSLNFEEDENAHFEEEFGLDGPTLVITLQDGRDVVKWVRLDRVWEIYDDVAAFDKYVLGTVEEYLTAASKIAAERNQPR